MTWNEVANASLPARDRLILFAALGVPPCFSGALPSAIEIRTQKAVSESEAKSRILALRDIGWTIEPGDVRAPRGEA